MQYTNAIGWTLFLILSSASCVPWGSAQQAIITRTAMEKHQQYIIETQQEIATRLARLSSHPGANMLLSQIFLTTQPQFPLASVTFEKLHPHLGNYQEKSPGIFQRKDLGDSELTSSLSIEYLDGTEVVFNIQFTETQTNIMNTFSISLGSPPATGALLYYQNSIYNGLIQGTRLSGNIQFIRNSDTPTHLAMDIYHGTWRINPCNFDSPFIDFCTFPFSSASKLISGRHIDFVDQKNNHERRMHRNLIVYTPSDQTGVWLAKQIGIKWEHTGFLHYDINIKAKAIDALNTIGPITYRGSGDVVVYLDENHLIRKSPNPVRVASPTGGPYTCDLSNLVTPGSGSQIVLRWSDHHDDPILPTEELHCAQLIRLQ
jgi:hypothetical protein